ncbi:MAG: hypothetical protein LIO93_10900 [Bacteroidales bacterium]|nr:hypothetical protein [Bacteroidales bacterium]
MNITKGLLYIKYVEKIEKIDAALIRQVKVDANDVFLQYGVFLTEDSSGSFTNYSALLAAPKMKPYVSVSFREDNGEKLPEKLPDPAYEGRDVTLYFAILADTPALFLSKYLQFIDLLKSGWLAVYLPELDLDPAKPKLYKMYYKESSGYQQLTPIEGKVAAKFKVVFREPNPVF